MMATLMVSSDPKHLPRLYTEHCLIIIVVDQCCAQNCIRCDLKIVLPRNCLIRGFYVNIATRPECARVRFRTLADTSGVRQSAISQTRLSTLITQADKKL